MPTSSKYSLQVANAILSGSRDDNFDGVVDRDSERSANEFLLGAWAATSTHEAQDLLQEALSLDPQNELAQTGLQWINGLLDLAHDTLTDFETQLNESESELDEESTSDETALSLRVATTELITVEDDREDEGNDQDDLQAEWDQDEHVLVLESDDEVTAEEVVDSETESSDEEVLEMVELSEEEEFQLLLEEEARIEAEKAVEEEQRLEEEAEAKRREEEEAEAKRLAEEEEARLAAEAEAKRLEEEAEQRRLEEEAEAKRLAEKEEARLAAEAEAKRLEEEAEQRRLEEEAEAKRLAEEEEACLAAEAEAKRLEEEAEAKRREEEEAAEAKRREEEAEEERIAAEAARQAEEAEAARLAEEAAEAEAKAEAERLEAEAEAEKQRLEEEAEQAEALRREEEAEAEIQRLEEQAAQVETESFVEDEEEVETSDAVLREELDSQLGFDEESATEEPVAEESVAEELFAADLVTEEPVAELTEEVTSLFETEETPVEDLESSLHNSVTELSSEVREAVTPKETPATAEESTSQGPVESTPVGETPENDRPLVLAVDDSPTIQKLVSMTLSREGFEVITAADGLEALQLLTERLPDIILSDVNMPRLDGYKLCRFVKKQDRLKHIPVVMLSGKDGVFDKLRGKMFGCGDYISKPFESSDLIEKVRFHTGVYSS